MLLSISDFKNYIGYSKDTFDTEIEVLLKGAEAFVKRYCNNIIEQTQVSEIFDGDDITGDIYLKNNLDLKDVKVYKWDSVAQNWDEIVDVYGSEYYVYADEGRISLNTILSGKRNYKVDYKAGYLNNIYETNTMPDDLRIAILKVTNKYWNKRRSDGLTSESLDSASLNYDEFMSSDIKAILGKYKIILI